MIDIEVDSYRGILERETVPYGGMAFTEDRRAALRKYDTKRVYIAYDRDEAGDHTAARSSPKSSRRGASRVGANHRRRRQREFQ